MAKIRKRFISFCICFAHESCSWLIVILECITFTMEHTRLRKKIHVTIHWSMLVNYFRAFSSKTFVLYWNVIFVIPWNSFALIEMDLFRSRVEDLLFSYVSDLELSNRMYWTVDPKKNTGLGRNVLGDQIESTFSSCNVVHRNRLYALP